MKDCAHVRALLFDYASGKLEDRAAQQVKKHIEECEVCRKEYEAQKFYFENLPSVSEYIHNSQKDIKTSVMQKIEQEKENPPIYVPGRFHFSYGTAASLVLVAALFLFAMKTGIVQPKLDSDMLESCEPAEEEFLDEEGYFEEYDYSTADYASGTGAVDNGEVYFSATTTNDAYYDVNAPAEKPEERIMMMAAPPVECAENECTEEAAATEETKKKTGTQCDGISVLTLEKLREIVAEKGENMSWGDFGGYMSENGMYPVSADCYLLLTDDEIRLVSVYDENDFIILPDGDIDSFVTDISNRDR